jgi:hypothetical protein
MRLCLFFIQNYFSFPSPRRRAWRRRLTRTAGCGTGGEILGLCTRDWEKFRFFMVRDSPICNIVDKFVINDAYITLLKSELCFVTQAPQRGKWVTPLFFFIEIEKVISVNRELCYKNSILDSLKREVLYYISWGGHCCLMHCDLFKIYCAPPNVGITRTWICRLNFP